LASPKPPKAVITGASGFIGSHLARELIGHGWDVAIVTRNRDFAHCIRLANEWARLTVFESDVRHRETLDQMIRWRPDVVVHLAAFNHVGESFKHVEEVYEVNALGSANVLDVVDGRAGVVYVSSSEVYGHQREVPWGEDLPAAPKSPYAITKYAGELHALMHQRLGNPVAVVRPFNTFGPGQSEKAVIPDIIIKALEGIDIRCTEGKQTREFNYVGDIVAGLRLVADNLKDARFYEGPINLAAMAFLTPWSAGVIATFIREGLIVGGSQAAISGLTYPLRRRVDPEFGNPYNDIGAYLMRRGEIDEARNLLNELSADWQTLTADEAAAQHHESDPV